MTARPDPEEALPLFVERELAAIHRLQLLRKIVVLAVIVAAALAYATYLVED